MNIIVCVKQVPDTTDIRMDPETHTLVRAGAATALNPFDKYALEAALLLKDACGGTVTAVTMGPSSAAEVLRECYAIGADRMVLISDRLFGGSDTYSTGYILSQAIRALGPYDLILCGKQAIDGDTAQVGPQIAEHLRIPQLTYVSEVCSCDSFITVVRELDSCYERTTAALPALLTVVKNPHEVRLPNVMRRLRANRMEPELITHETLPELDLSLIGLEGSPTKVKTIFKPLRKKNVVLISGSRANTAAEQLLELLETVKNVSLPEAQL